MANRLKAAGLILGCLLFSASTFSQVTNGENANLSNVGSFDLAPNYNRSNSFILPSYRGNASSFRGGNSMAIVETFMRQLNLRMPPTGYRFVSASGINFQAGLLMNSRQPKLGASFSMPRGFNFSAGYGINSSNLMKPGSMSMGRSPGLQFSASYRLFKRNK
jgi:hypothetical protein